MIARFTSAGLDELFDVLRKYVRPGNDYVLEISKEISSSQRKFYFAVVVKLFCEVTGYTRNRGHKILARSFLPTKNGETMSITELSTVQMEQYIETCRLHLWHGYKIVAPEPNGRYAYDKQLMEELDRVFKY